MLEKAPRQWRPCGIVALPSFVAEQARQCGAEAAARLPSLFIGSVIVSSLLFFSLPRHGEKMQNATRISSNEIRRGKKKEKDRAPIGNVLEPGVRREGRGESRVLGSPMRLRWVDWADG